jgi:hypothetical protein
LADNWRNGAVIALEPVPDLGVQTLLDHELARQVKLFNEEERASMTTTRITVCGLTAQTTTHRSAKAGLVTSLDVVTKAGGQAYITGVTVATKEDNATRRRDAETIVAGFQVLPPRRCSQSERPSGPALDNIGRCSKHNKRPERYASI